MDLCSRCPRKHNFVPPSGPSSDTMFIGEGPGKDEDKLKVPFQGKTGQEVNQHYLPLAGLRRDQCYFTNGVKCWPDTPGHKLDIKKRAHRELVQSCADAHLYQEMVDVNPKLLVPMGAIACWAVDPDINLEVQHGFVVETRWGIPAFPMYHPARGLHEPKRMLQIRADWARLRLLLGSRLPVYRDEYPYPDYREVTDAAEILELDPGLPLAADTESSPSLGPYCLTFSQRAGTARLIRASRTDLLAALQERLARWQAIIVFHNWLYDRQVTIEMGLRFPDRCMRDTMLWAYHLGNLPQGLKALAWRELGMEMQDFDDVVRPHSTRLVLDYYSRAMDIRWPKPEEQLLQDSKTGLWKLKKPQSMNTKLKRFFTDYDKADEGDKDVFKMWTDNWVEEHAMIEAKLGPWPGLDIAHVPFEQMLHYACRDADAGIRMVPVLLGMRAQVGHAPPEKWRVA